MTPDQMSQVQWAMSTVVRKGGTGSYAAMADGRAIIAKTGTTTSNRSAFFIGAIPQYALTVGIYTQKQADCLDKVQPAKPSLCHKKNLQSLDHLGGNSQGGFGGYWPARIWNTFAEAEFASLPQQSFLPPVFTGDKWVMVLPKPTCGQNGTNPTASPTPTSTGQPGQANATCCPTPGQPGQPGQPVTQQGGQQGGQNNANCCPQQGQQGGQPGQAVARCPKNGGGKNGGKGGKNGGKGGFPTGQPTQPTANPTQNCIPPFCLNTPTPTASASTSSSPTATSTAGKGGGGNTPTVGAQAIQSGFALGGLASVLPGSLLWSVVARRRRRAKRRRD
jgi:hypothetical protein